MIIIAIFFITLVYYSSRFTAQRDAAKPKRLFFPLMFATARRRLMGGLTGLQPVNFDLPPLKGNRSSRLGIKAPPQEILLIV